MNVAFVPSERVPWPGRASLHLWWAPWARGSGATDRAVARVLACYPGGAAVSIVRQASGRPELVDAPAGLSVSLAHSGDRLLLAIGSAAGVDLERSGRTRSWRAIARQYFDPTEARWIEAQSDVERAFLRLWTAKEALLKARGIGLAQGLRRVVLDPATLAILSLPDEPDPSHWRLRLFAPEPGWHGALATPDEPASIETYRLEPRKT